MEDPVPRLGVDVGGVIVQLARPDGNDSSFFGPNPDETPPVDGAFGSLARLNERFDGHVHLVSKAGPRIEQVTRSWLDANSFFVMTGIAPVNLHFVRERPAKAEVAQALGLTHFLDDRIDVLVAMPDVPERYLFLPGRDGRRGIKVPPPLMSAADWSSFEGAVHDRHSGFAGASDTWRLPPAYQSLVQILRDAGVEAIPTDRDLAPLDRHNDDTPFCKD
jgi:hypothetical protein